MGQHQRRLRVRSSDATRQAFSYTTRIMVVMMIIIMKMMANVACLRAAGAGGRAPAPGVPTAVGGWPELEDAAGAALMEEAIEELLLQAAVAAGVDL